jgi:hypothetical protein
VKKTHHTIRKQGQVNEQELTTFLTKNGQGLLPMVDLIEQSRMRAAWKMEAKAGMARIRKLAEWLEREYASAAASLLEGLECAPLL